MDQKDKEAVLAQVPEDMRAQTARLLDLCVYQTPEDLPEGLREYVVWEPGNRHIKCWFQHPFLVHFFPLATPVSVAEHIAMKVANAAARLEAGDPQGYLFVVEKPFRMQKLVELARGGYFDRFEDREARFWGIAASVWTNAEHAEDDPIWTELMRCDEVIADRHLMTAEEDRFRLHRMPDEVTVYRGFSGPTREDAFDMLWGGWSWTLSEEKAAFFAERFLREGETGYVAQGFVDKDHIVALLTGRGEEEVLIEPELAPDVVKEVHVVRRIDAPPQRVRDALGVEIMRGFDTIMGER